MYWGAYMLMSIKSSSYIELAWLYQVVLGFAGAGPVLLTRLWCSLVEQKQFHTTPISDKASLQPQWARQKKKKNLLIKQV